MRKFNFLSNRNTPVDHEPEPVVRVRANAQDRYHGLKGHAYIAARQLPSQVVKLSPAEKVAA